MEAKIKYLGMVQNVINRMANNSFLLKGWMVTIVSALIALEISETSNVLLVVAILPIVMFWTLDAYFLRQERLFRKLYDRVRILDADQIDFSMNTLLFKNDVSSWIRVMFSITLIVFYGTTLLAILVILFVMTK
jgi:uncharacterized membrane protein